MSIEKTNDGFIFFSILLRSKCPTADASSSVSLVLLPLLLCSFIFLPLFAVVVLFHLSWILFLSPSSLSHFATPFFYFFTVPRIMALLCWTKFRIICNTRGWKVLLLLHWTDWVSPVWNRIDGAGWQRVDVCAFYRVLYLILF